MIPKPGYLSRPALVLRLEDEVVYTLLVGKLFSSLLSRILPNQGVIDISHHLSTDLSTVDWVKSDFQVWRQWREKSIETLTDSISHVVVADIAGFYDNIDLDRLRRTLEDWGCDKDVLKALFGCLNRWVSPRGKGLPQNYAASHILAKVYLFPADEQLRSDGLVFLRYVDDIRVFLSSHRDAQLAIKRVTELYHRFGLTMQSAKTEIIEAEEARSRIDGVNPVIDRVRHNLSQDYSKATLLLAPSISPSEEAAVLDSLPPDDTTVLERAFHEKFLIDNRRFDKTLFHYLVNQLGRVKSPIAVDYCLAVLRTRMDETDFILRYIKSFPPQTKWMDEIVNHFTSPETTSEYQLFQILRWFFAQGYVNDKILQQCRALGYDRNVAPWLRSYALAYIGANANGSDHGKLQEEYERASTEIEKADIITALTSLETSQRNTFYGRVKGDGDLVDRAIQLARSRA